MLEVVAASAADDPLTSVMGVIQVVLEYVGTIAFAISGAVAAGRKRMDLVGVVVLACLVAVGGGTLRDVLVGNLPVFWVRNPTYLLVAILTAIAVVALTRTRALDVLQRFHVIQVSDAAGMAVFVVTGTNVALAAGASDISAAIIGVLSGVGGGIIRDILADEVPDVLRSGQFYATAALAGAAVYVGLLALDVDPLLVFWIPIVLILVIRLVSLRFGWGVPTFSYGAPDDGAGPVGGAERGGSG
ncbi:trimeric intracellular cation channel family protein [Agromyces tropicus]|uniref:Trimeric intracellular cation channel family protein n=1 Tax=Agromyces tropicus TaxID=555371 RepID=A0ABN2UG40_9MICO